jgi:thiopurine S-methyltransferase
MDARFWHQRWEENNTFWHQSEANPRLTANFNQLSVAKGGRIFLPMCGKTLDISWLLSRGYRVAGAELSKIAIEQLFAGLGVKPKISALGKLDHYSAKNMEIFGGDIFDLSEKTLGRVDAIYDRAALVALPSTTRERYTAHLMDITAKAPQLLISWEYDQSLMEGPPFSVTGDEIKKHYGKSYNITLIETKNVPGGLKGKCAATENVWLLKND